MANRLVEIRLKGIDNNPGEIVLPIKDLTILTGKNGSGKTRFLKYLKLIREEFGLWKNTRQNKALSFFPLELKSSFLKKSRYLSFSFSFELEYFPNYLTILTGEYEHDFGDGLKLLSCELSDSYNQRIKLFEFAFSDVSPGGFFLDSLLLNAREILQHLELEIEDETNISLPSAGSQGGSMDDGANSKLDLENTLASWESQKGNERFEEVLSLYSQHQKYTEFVTQDFVGQVLTKMKDFHLAREPKYSHYDNLSGRGVAKDRYLGEYLQDSGKDYVDFVVSNSYESQILNVDLFDFFERDAINIEGLFFVSLYVEKFNEYARLTDSPNATDRAKGEEILKQIVEQINVPFLFNLEQQFLLRDLPFRLSRLTYLMGEQMKSIVSFDFSLDSPIQPGLPKSIHQLLNSSEFKSMDSSYYIGTFIRYWLKSFEIGEDLILESAGDYYDIRIKESGNIFGLADLSKGEKRVVLLILAIATQAYPGGFLPFIEVLNNDSFALGMNSDQISYLLEHVRAELKLEEDISQKVFPKRSLNQTQIILYLEEPESHLHPNSQSLLADLIVDAFNRFGLDFIIETHSEYFIRKIQYWIARKQISPNNTLVGYMDRKSPEFLRDLHLQNDGTFKQNFGPGFFDEATRWKFELLKSQNSN